MVRHANILRRPCRGRAVWGMSDLASSRDWVQHLSPAHVGEIERALRAVHNRGVPLLKVTAADFPLPTLARELRRIADVLENGTGVALIKRIPSERYSESAAGLVFWALCQYLGTPVSQNSSGHMLGHVRDTGRTMGDPATRGYQTREMLPFHTSGSDVLGLMCLRAARSGARISVASSGAVYNAILARRPDLVERLYRTHFLDRREEQAPGESPYSLRAARLLVRREAERALPPLLSRIGAAIPPRTPAGNGRHRALRPDGRYFRITRPPS